jgi:hypothetical protein
MPRRNLTDIIISWIKALVLLWCKEDAPNRCKVEFASESDKWCSNGRLGKLGVFPKLYTIYIQREQIAGPKSDYFTQASCCHFPCVRCLSLLLKCKRSCILHVYHNCKGKYKINVDQVGRRYIPVFVFHWCLLIQFFYS